MCKWIKRTVEENTTRSGRVFDIVMITLIVLALTSYALETIPDLSEDMRALLRYFEWFIVIVFTAEYLTRLLVADNKRQFVRSWYAIFDLIAVTPFYLSLLFGPGQYVALLRMFRLFRAFKLMRYNKAIQLFHKAFLLAKDELILFLIVTLMLLYLSGAMIYIFENPVQPKVYSSVFSSLWWAIVTLTTVGYGDMIPSTLVGRIFTFVLLIVSLGTIAVPSGIVASALSKARELQNADANSDDKLENAGQTRPDDTDQ